MKQLALALALFALLLVSFSATQAQSSGPARRLASTTFANLGTPDNGNIRYCSDCAATAPCTSGGGGATATRVNGAWNCSLGGGGDRPFIDVRDYGAVGDGVTNNSTALQNAINAGYAVFVPTGTFNFSTTLTLKKDSMILGTGRKSILRYTGTGVALQELVGSYTGGYDNLKLKDFTLTTNSVSTTGIELTNNYQVTLDGLYIDGNTTGFTIAGIHFKSASAVNNSAVLRVTNGEIWLCAGDGIRISGSQGVAGLWVEHEHITGNAWGINQTIPNPPYPASEIQIVNNVIEGNTLGGVNAEVLYASSITGNHFENSAGSTATLLKIGTLGFAQGLTIEHNVLSGTSATYLIDMNGGAVKASIAKNSFLGASIAAIRVAYAVGLTVALNTLDGSVASLISVTTSSRGVWVQDEVGVAYYSASTASAQPNFRLNGFVVQPEGAVLAITANAIAPTTQIHHVGAGLIKTITVPTGFTGGTIYLIPDAAFTWDATGNLLGSGTAVVNRVLTFTYSSASAKWVPGA